MDPSAHIAAVLGGKDPAKGQLIHAGRLAEESFWMPIDLAGLESALCSLARYYLPRMLHQKSAGEGMLCCPDWLDWRDYAIKGLREYRDRLAPLGADVPSVQQALGRFPFDLRESDVGTVEGVLRFIYLLKRESEAVEALEQHPMTVKQIYDKLRQEGFPGTPRSANALRMVLKRRNVRPPVKGARGQGRADRFLYADVKRALRPKRCQNES